MKLSNKQKRAASFGIVGLLGIVTGQFLPPELILQMLGGMGL